MAFEVQRGGAPPRTFSDPEEAVRFAQRSARRTGETRRVYNVTPAWVDRAGKHPIHHKRRSQEVAQVSPTGRVDLTFYGGSIVACQNPRTIKEMLA